MGHHHVPEHRHRNLGSRADVQFWRCKEFPVLIATDSIQFSQARARQDPGVDLKAWFEDNLLGAVTPITCRIPLSVLGPSGSGRTQTVKNGQMIHM